MSARMNADEFAKRYGKPSVQSRRTGQAGALWTCGKHRGWAPYWPKECPECGNSVGGEWRKCTPDEFDEWARRNA